LERLSCSCSLWNARGASAPTQTKKNFKVSGGHGGEETPVPIPNTEVKLASADGTWGETPWESRSPPDFSLTKEPRKGLLRRFRPRAVGTMRPCHRLILPRRAERAAEKVGVTAVEADRTAGQSAARSARPSAGPSGTATGVHRVARAGRPKVARAGRPKVARAGRPKVARAGRPKVARIAPRRLRRAGAASPAGVPARCAASPAGGVTSPRTVRPPPRGGTRDGGPVRNGRRNRLRREKSGSPRNGSTAARCPATERAHHGNHGPAEAGSPRRHRRTWVPSSRRPWALAGRNVCRGDSWKRPKRSSGSATTMHAAC